MTIGLCILILLALLATPILAGLCIRYGTEPDRPWPRELDSGISPAQQQREAA